MWSLRGSEVVWWRGGPAVTATAEDKNVYVMMMMIRTKRETEEGKEKRQGVGELARDPVQYCRDAATKES